jgi:NhaP-type Na+/H+ or K+/H+ antiporter
MGTFVFFLPLGWSWNLSMVFGSILAATDPVAVVALLKSAGASPKLTILIIGESLLNDGTAMVLFTLFFDMLKGKHYDGGDVILFFIKMALGSPLFGALVGLVSVYVMSFLNKPLSNDDVTVQIAITICCAYMTFFMAEYECRMSGLLACCGAGAMFAWLSPPLILEHESMHHVWGIIEWTGNTLIFLLAGLIIGSETIHIVTANDWGYLFLLYAFLQVLRCFVVAVLYPAVANVGLKCSRNDAIFMAWAGLRGALGMALALIVQGNRSESDLSKHDTDRVFFFVGGIAALTLIINATTARHVLEFLGLLKRDTPDKVLVMDQIRKRLRHRLMKEVRHFQKDMHIADIDDIIKHNTLLQNEARESIAGKDDSGRRSSLSVGGADRTLSRRTSNCGVLNDLLEYVRTVFLEIVRVEYWHRIEDGRLPREASATQSLLYSIDNALDRVHKKRLRDWKWLNNEMSMSPTLLWVASLLQKWSYPTSSLYSVLDVMEARNEELRVYILTNFIEAHEAAQKKIFRFMGEEDAEVDENFRTPETALVLQESQDSVSDWMIKVYQCTRDKT